MRKCAEPSWLATPSCLSAWGSRAGASWHYAPDDTLRSSIINTHHEQKEAPEVDLDLLYPNTGEGEERDREKVEEIMPRHSPAGPGSLGLPFQVLPSETSNVQ